jgi:hypothetical protein
MPARKRPTPEDTVTAHRVLLDGLARDADIFELVSELAPLHRRDNTFPGEVFIRVAADALDWCGASRADPLPLEGLRERFLPECTFRGRENTKFQYAVLAAAAPHGGTEPDLLDEVAWWQADDFWRYALFAAVACIRAAASRAGVPVRQACQDLGERPAGRRHNDQFGTQRKRSSDGGAAEHIGGLARVLMDSARQPVARIGAGQVSATVWCARGRQLW